MYELSRVRLYSVGPPGARYADVVLDFRGVGARVRGPAQNELFAAVPGDEPVRRPSPASVLFLENGGGKSVLIKLIFSVMLPGRRQVVGTTNTRVLEKFVQATDVAHVVCEWQHTLTGQLRVTGKVSEWQGHVVSSDVGKLIDRWYSFQPSASLNLDTLPFTEGGRMLTMTGFHDKLAEAHRLAPELQFGWEKNHGDWTTHLANLGLDTELFRYQRAMNAGEGEAADVFSFKTDEAFIDFLLRAVTVEEDPRGLAEVVDRYAHKLATRADLVAERDFVVGALERLGPVAEAEAEAETARQLAHDARTEAQRFLSSVFLRHEAECERLATLQDHLGDLAQAEQKADQEQRRLNSVVLELRRIVAEFRLKEAEALAQQIEEQRDDARTRHEAWRATRDVLTYRSSSNRARELRILVAGREDAARPALEARNQAVRALARGLLATIGRAESERTTAQSKAETLKREARAANGEYEEWLRAAERERGKADRAAEAITETQAAMEEATNEGWLPPGIDVTAAAEQAEQDAVDAAEAVTDGLALLEQLSESREDAVAAQKTAEQEETEARKADDKATEEAESALATAESLRLQNRLIALLGTDAVTLDSDTPTLIERLEDAVGTAEQEVTELTIAHRADQKVLAALGTGGLLPDPYDIGCALTMLRDAGIPAWSGWRYLSKMPRDKQAVVQRKFPHLVDGVVLNNPDHLTRAQEVLEQARLLPTSLVAVGTTAAMDSTGNTAAAGLGFLVPPNPAMYDEDAAEGERQEIQERTTDRLARLKALQDQISADRSLADRLRGWWQDFPPGKLGRLQAEQAEAARILAEATGAVTSAVEAAEKASRAEKDQRARIPGLRDNEHRQRTLANQLAALADQVADLDERIGAQREATQAAHDAEQAATDAKTRGEELGDQREEQVRLADDHGRTVSECREELKGLLGGGAVDESLPDPRKPLEELRRMARDAESAYAKAEVPGALRADLEQAETNESAARASPSTNSRQKCGASHRNSSTPPTARAPHREPRQQSAPAERSTRSIGDWETRRNASGNARTICDSSFPRIAHSTPMGGRSASSTVRNSSPGRAAITETPASTMMTCVNRNPASKPKYACSRTPCAAMQRAWSR